jgi:two-component system chemotaxis response regulator CheY
MKRIMIVDDTMYSRATLRDLLVAHGYQVVAEAKAGEEALKLYPKIRPDVVIMDASMPGMDGVAATRELKRKHPEARIILAASMGQRAAMVAGMSAGADDFIAKPYAARRVLQAIRGATRSPQY